MDSILNYQNNTSIGEYVYSQSFINSLRADDRHLAMYAIRSLRIDKSFDNISEIVDYVNKLDEQGQSPALFEKLYAFRGDKYVSLNQPSNLKGWINRLNSFYALNKPYAISTKEKTSAFALVLGIGLIALGGAYLYVRTKRN